MTPIRVLIADDQKAVRDGLATLLGLLDGLDVIGTAIDGADAVRQTLDTAPDIVLMDLKMPHMDGVEAIRRLADAGSSAKVVVLTTYAEDDWVFRALQAGARGFLTKDAGAAEIQQAIVAVAAGDAQLDPSVQRRLLEELARRPVTAERYQSSPPDDALTARELEVLVLVAGGHSNSEIAALLYVSTATVKTHINHLLAKTACRNRAELVSYAYRTGRADARQ